VVQQQALPFAEADAGQVSEKMAFNFVAIPHELFRYVDRGLIKPDDVTVYWYITDCIGNPKRPDFPGSREAARFLQRRRHDVQASIARLERYQLIRRKQRRHGAPVHYERWTPPSADSWPEPEPKSGPHPGSPRDPRLGSGRTPPTPTPGGPSDPTPGGPSDPTRGPVEPHLASDGPPPSGRDLRPEKGRQDPSVSQSLRSSPAGADGRTDGLKALARRPGIRVAAREIGATDDQVAEALRRTAEAVARGDIRQVEVYFRRVLQMLVLRADIEPAVVKTAADDRASRLAEAATDLVRAEARDTVRRGGDVPSAVRRAAANVLALAEFQGLKLDLDAIAEDLASA